MFIVKAVMLLVAQYQAINPSIFLYIVEIGTDQEKSIFLYVCTQDYAQNCNRLQLGQKASIRAKINRMYNTHPKLHTGHKRQSITSISTQDHINTVLYPDTLHLDVALVNLLEQWDAGHNNATNLLCQGIRITPNWTPFYSLGVDNFMRLFGKYAGFLLNASTSVLAVDASKNNDDNLNTPTIISLVPIDPEQTTVELHTSKTVIDLDTLQQQKKIRKHLKRCLAPRLTMHWHREWMMLVKRLEKLTVYSKLTRKDTTNLLLSLVPKFFSSLL